MCLTRSGWGRRDAHLHRNVRVHRVSSVSPFPDRGRRSVTVAARRWDRLAWNPWQHHPRPVRGIAKMSCRCPGVRHHAPCTWQARSGIRGLDRFLMIDAKVGRSQQGSVSASGGSQPALFSSWWCLQSSRSLGLPCSVRRCVSSACGERFLSRGHRALIHTRLLVGSAMRSPPRRYTFLR